MTSARGWEEDLQARLAEIFAAEAAERLAALDAAVAALAGGATGAEADHHLGEAYRQAHTLKGGARAIGRAGTERLSSALESTLDRLRGGAPAGPDTWGTLAVAVDVLRTEVAGEVADVEAVVDRLNVLGAPPE